MMRSPEPEKMLEPVHPISADDNRKARRAREAELRKRNEDLLKENERLRMALYETIEIVQRMLQCPSNRPKEAIVTEHPFTRIRDAYTPFELLQGEAKVAIEKYKRGK